MVKDDPSIPQRRATDPRISAWVGANAGSGKTHVLTERVARLLLEGAEPGRILCLTYTKAAAAEMQRRLFETLGKWSMQPDEVLGLMLGELSGEEPERSSERLAEARRLFARALETPGGLKIQTIHAFCEALLRRFPLEAAIAPGFDVLDDRRAALMLAGIRDRLAQDAEMGRNSAFDGLADRLNEDRIDGMIRAVLARRAGFRKDVEALILRYFGDAVGRSAEELARDCLASVKNELKQMAKVFATGSQTDEKISVAFSAAEQESKKDPLSAGQRIIDATLVKSGDNKGQPISRNPTKALREAHPECLDQFLKIAKAAQTLVANQAAHETAERMRDLYRFATAFLDAYEEEKAAHSLLDFDDLINRAGDLLERSDMRAWVLYKLDRGIDHVLVDEAQDTASVQWKVIQAITDDFHSGDSGRATDSKLDRSVFVVGDEKQSIYSFQGADPRTFDYMRESYEERLAGIEKTLERPALLTSFRSAPGILEFVDAVFAGSAGESMTGSDEQIEHKAYRAQAPARVDLWPPIEPEEEVEDPHWSEPLDPKSQPPPVEPRRRLAKDLADEIHRMIAEECLPARNNETTPRPVTPGDILVLVRKRDELAKSLIRNLKVRGVPVTGADRLTLAEELAVQDLLSLIKAVLNHEDDLSLAEVLRSPLCSVSEDDLFNLAHGRKGTLWATLMASKSHDAEKKMLNDLAKCAGNLAPFEFLERVLIYHDGRRRLLARLGLEAEDPIDEMLAQALSFEERQMPSLHGFVAWIEAGDIALKREMDKGAGEVRVMTVHGAKGLEAPIVILPDTMGKMGDVRDLLLPFKKDTEEELILWPPGDDSVTMEAKKQAEERNRAEEMRLLYVGLTRAEDWLILAGAKTKRVPSEHWYGMLETAFDELERDKKVLLTKEKEFRRIASGNWPKQKKSKESGAKSLSKVRPDWVAKAEWEPSLRRIAPSQIGPSEAPKRRRSESLSPAEARKRGDVVHIILERLPGAADPAYWPEIAKRLIKAEADPGLSDDLKKEAREEALAVMGESELEWVFAENTLGEVAVSIPVDVPGIRPMQGRIDRLVVGDKDIVIVDFKTDLNPPEREEDVSKRYMSQLGAYREALVQIYPARTIKAGLLWTRTRQYMELDSGQLDAAWQDAREGIDSVGSAL